MRMAVAGPEPGGRGPSRLASSAEIRSMYICVNTLMPVEF